MLDKLKKDIKNRKVLVLGFGREGHSTLRTLMEAGGYESLAIADEKPRTKDIPDSIPWFSGAGYQKVLDDFDIVFKSPGVVLEKEARTYSCRLTSETQVFFECFRNQVVGITGTKGKSTTTTLVYHILKENNVKCLLAGNIGIPAFDIVKQVEPDTEVVFELSSHQLEYMDVSPKIAVLTNIHEEHLDHYGTMEKYVAAKKNVYLHQADGDLFFCNKENLPEEGEARGKVIPVDLNGTLSDGLAVHVIHNRIYFDGHELAVPLDEIKLLGEHNLFDIGVAYGVCRTKGVDDEGFLRALKTYKPLPHRLQYIGCFGGIKYYDDSISTICDTTLQALNSIRDVDTVLIGGMDRGLDYGELIAGLSAFPDLHVIFMEETGQRIYREIQENYPWFQNRERLYLTKHLPDAVALAETITQKGGSCVLSPAAASYGIFKNFEERGNAFQKLVKKAGR